MPAAGQTKVKFNDKFFDDILHSAGVENMCLSKAQQALANVRAAAPVDPARTAMDSASRFISRRTETATAWSVTTGRRFCSNPRAAISPEP